MPMTNAAEYLERTAARVPDKIAFSDASGSLTFGQLLTRARALGTVLAGLPGCKNAPVAVLTGRTVQSVAALQGVLQSGNYYVPIDEQMPEARMRRILTQVHARAIVFSESSRPQAERLTDCAPLVCLEEAEKTAPDDALLQARREQIIDLDPVYLLFTSGSTGTPKGIVISHRAILDFTDWLTDFCGYTEHEVFGNQSPFFYANSIIDIFPPALLGAKACMIPATALSFPKTLVNYLRQKGITELTMTPSSFVQVANSGVLTENCLPELEYMIMSGEVMPWAQLAVWMNAAPKGHAWNFYGSTEMFSVSVGKVEGNYEAGQLIPVGKPFPTVKIRFMTDDGQAAAPGEAGEMYVSSPMVSQAYYRDEERSRAVYVADPLGQEPGVWFRSGDYGFLDAQGQLNVLGRKDSMVKHHGYRMELGEVEAALRSIPGCLEACCLLDKEQDVLWAFAAGNLTEKALMDALKTKLARYMLPDKIVLLPELPHTANMKIDRQTLRKRMTEQG